MAEIRPTARARHCGAVDRPPRSHTEYRIFRASIYLPRYLGTFSTGPFVRPFGSGLICCSHNHLFPAPAPHPSHALPPVPPYTWKAPSVLLAPERSGHLLFDKWPTKPVARLSYFGFAPPPSTAITNRNTHNIHSVTTSTSVPLFICSSFGRCPHNTDSSFWKFQGRS